MMLFKNIIPFMALAAAAATAQAQQPAALPPAYPPTVNLNAVRTWEAQRPGLDTGSIKNAPANEVRLATGYFDGLGRPLQTVVRQASPLGKDLVSMHSYDAFNREARQYLPYISTDNNGKFKPDPFAMQATFAQAQYPGETYFYGQTEFEPGPLNRPLKTMPAGNNWMGAGRGAQAQYGTNAEADSVLLWRVPNNSNGQWASYTKDGFYPPGRLRKTLAIDEHGHQTIEYKDEAGKTLLKKVQLAETVSGGHTGWACTYYIHDSYGRLRCVLQPKAVTALMGNGGQLTGAILDGLAFRYEYDHRNRPIVKKVPDAGEVYMVYDGRDRLAMTQDGNLRLQGKWLVMRYDGLNRPIATYLWANAQPASYHWQQANTGSDYPQWPSLQGSELLTETYYDGYGFAGAAAYSGAYQQYLNAGNDAHPDFLPPGPTAKGLVTGSKTKVLNAQPGQPQYLVTTVYYDSKDRPIQTHAQNLRGGTDITTNGYGWAGKLLCTYLHHRNPASVQTPELRVSTRMEYDKDGRLVKTFKKIQRGTGDNQPETVLAVQRYDELGQLRTKHLGTANGGNGPLETLDYGYNIRGWLTSINKDYAKGYSNANYFGQLLSYDKVFDAAGGAAQYNGNIGGIRWRARGDGEQRNYGFAYDAANRLLRADFTQYNGGGWNTAAGVDYSVGGADSGRMAYDANGNILSMWQKGMELGSSQWIDRLGYAYQPASNKLAGVTDQANNKASTLGDFKYDPATKTATDYRYDANGNMTADNNKAIGAIAYNHLNLPQLITVTNKGTVTYVHDAAGNKLQKRTVEGNRTTVTDYIAGIEYKNDTLQQVGHEEGRARWVKQYFLNGDSAWLFAYDFFIKDHLGSIRTVLTNGLDTTKYVCTFEPPKRDKEREHFVRRDDAIVGIGVDNPLYEGPGIDGGNESPASQFACRLNGLYYNRTIGPGKVIKVMAGDKVELATRAYCPPYNAENIQHLPPQDVLASLLPLLVGGNAATVSHGAQTYVQGNGVTLEQGSLLNFIANNQNGTPNGQVKAYLNYIVFDYQYKPVNSGAIKVAQNLDVPQSLYNLVPILHNGYIYVWLSNATTVDVYFDNLSVTHYTGAMLEENAYYPYGLRMGGISANAAHKQPNAYKYNGKQLQNAEFSDNTGLEWTDYGARMYDQQIGRWGVVDPKADVYMEYSSYVYVGNNPIRRIDPNGAEWATDEDKAFAEDLRNQFGVRVRDLEAERIGLQRKIERVNGKKRLSDEEKKAAIAQINERLDDINSMMDNVKEAITELDELGADGTKYKYSFNDLGPNVPEGFLSLNKDGKTAVINFSYQFESTFNGFAVDKGARMAGIGHELKHAYQAEKGFIGLRAGSSEATFPNSAAAGLGHPLSLEAEAYKRQYSLNGWLPPSDSPGSNYGSINTQYVSDIYYKDGKEKKYLYKNYSPVKN
jgi:RHS repeat-associated protein